jgi:hypothetical protein
MRKAFLANSGDDVIFFAAESAEHSTSVTTLSDPDFDALFSSLIDASEPNEALKSGFRWYRKLTA